VLISFMKPEDGRTDSTCNWLQAEKEIELLRANDETDASTVEEQTEKYSIAQSRSRS
jgi:hypothetical protein